MKLLPASDHDSPIPLHAALKARPPSSHEKRWSRVAAPVLRTIGVVYHLPKEECWQGANEPVHPIRIHAFAGLRWSPNFLQSININLAKPVLRREPMMKGVSQFA